MNITMIARNRAEAANSANRDDAALWRWFCLMYEDRRLRWCASGSGWLVSVDHRHLATEFDFDAAIRSARDRFQTNELGAAKQHMRRSPHRMSSLQSGRNE